VCLFWDGRAMDDSLHLFIRDPFPLDSKTKKKIISIISLISREACEWYLFLDGYRSNNLVFSPIENTNTSSKFFKIQNRTYKWTDGVISFFHATHPHAPSLLPRQHIPGRGTAAERRRLSEGDLVPLSFSLSATWARTSSAPRLLSPSGSGWAPQ
jgi:hypothetical protein